MFMVTIIRNYLTHIHGVGLFGIVGLFEEVFWLLLWNKKQVVVKILATRDT